MRKIAVFTEGQTELIFIRKLIEIMFNYNYSEFYYEIFRLNGGEKIKGHPSMNIPPNPKVYFQLINAGCDETVISSIKRYENNLIKQSFDEIIGIRDMYSENYKKFSKNNIVDLELNKRFIDGWNTSIRSMNNPDKIKLFCSVMEIEAWFLSMYEIFLRMDGSIKKEDIIKILRGHENSVEKIYHPASIVSKIFGLFGLKYHKNESDSEKIVNLIEEEDINTGVSRSDSFSSLYIEIKDIMIN